MAATPSAMRPSGRRRDRPGGNLRGRGHQHDGPTHQGEGQRRAGRAGDGHPPAASILTNNTRAGAEDAADPEPRHRHEIVHHPGRLEERRGPLPDGQARRGGRGGRQRPTEPVLANSPRITRRSPRTPQHLRRPRLGWVASHLKALEGLPAGLKLEEQRVKVRDTIENTKNFPGTGGMFNLSAQDHVGLNAKDVVLVKIADGNWVYLPREKW